MLTVGVVVAVVVWLLDPGVLAPVVGWGAACAVYIVRVWWVLRHLDGEQTRDHAMSEDPGRRVSETLVLVSSVASLSAVGFLLVQAQQAHGTRAVALAAAAVASVALSWALIHTVYTLRYAVLHHRFGGFDFPVPKGEGDVPPTYADFAYVAFTVGMTYQLADTNSLSSQMRSTVLRHAMLSYLFGTIIFATTINLALNLAG